MVSFRLRLVGCAALLPLMAAAAQQAPAPRVKESVEVAGRRPAVQNLTDRQSYTIGADLQASAGSLSEVLRTLPSVEVDALGTVSLRGDANVTILIDGKVSPLLAGNRADALEQIPADSIDRIEVITNPSAEFKAEGSGGIINIITKKSAEPGWSGTVRANVGNEGRLNASASVSTKRGRYSLSGSYNERRDARLGSGTLVRSDATGDISGQTISSKSIWSGRTIKLGAGAELGDDSELELQGTYGTRNAHRDTIEHNTADVDGILTDYSRFGSGSRAMDIYQVSLEFSHDFATKGEQIKLELTRGTHWSLGTIDYTSLDTASGAATEWQFQSEKEREHETEIDASYVLPLGKTAKFKAGYALEDENNLFDTLGLYRFDPNAGWLTDSELTTRFTLHRAVHAGYATYEDKFADLGVLLGLRAEQEFLSTNLVTTGEAHKSSSLSFYPSLHLTYNLTDTKQLKLSYSRRVNRPDEEDLSPAVETHDAYNLYTGNPLLQPEEIDSFETAYQFAGDKLDGLVTGYYRITNKGITDVSTFISPTVLLTTKANLARSIATGIEATLNGDIVKELSFRLTGNLGYNEINPGATSIYHKRSGLTWSAKGGLDWQITPDDLFQVSGNYWAKHLLPQGYREPSFIVNAGFRHGFGDGLSAVATVNNLFDSFKYNTILNSPDVRQADKRGHTGRIIYFGFVYSFGGAKESEGNGDNGGGFEE